MSAQLDHRLVMGAAHGLRIDARAPARSSATSISRSYSIARISRWRGDSSASGSLSLRTGSTGSTASCAFGHRLDRHRYRPVAAQRVAGGAAGDDRQPGRQPGARRVVAAQQPEIILAQPQKDLLRQIFDLGRLARDAAHRGDDQPAHSAEQTPPRPRSRRAAARPGDRRLAPIRPCGRLGPAGSRHQVSAAKKSLPLSSMTIKAGKSTTSMRQIASMPSSGYSSTSTFRMQSCASRAAGPPIEPR